MVFVLDGGFDCDAHVCRNLICSRHLFILTAVANLKRSFLQTCSKCSTLTSNISTMTSAGIDSVINQLITDDGMYINIYSFSPGCVTDYWS